MDPGPDTGLTLLRATEEALRCEATAVARYDQARGFTPLTTIKRWRQEFPDGKHIFVYENFHIRPGAVNVELSALDVIKEVRDWIADEKPYAKVVVYEPVHGKHQIPNEVLERMGLLQKGGITRHANDATRHGVTYLTQLRHRPTSLLAFPK